MKTKELFKNFGMICFLLIGVLVTSGAAGVSANFTDDHSSNSLDTLSSDWQSQAAQRVTRHPKTRTVTSTPFSTTKPTQTLVPTSTPTKARTATTIPTNTLVPTVTATKTQMPTAAPTNTHIPTNIPTNTQIPTAIPTMTKSPTATPTLVQPPVTTTCQFAAIPAYFDPGQYWDQLTSTLQAGEVAIMNPSNGPGSSISDHYVSTVNAVKAKGIIVMGYVYTGYGTRDQNIIKAEIDKYANWYGVTAIFVDEVSTSVSYIPFYKTLYDYVKTRNGMVMINPGTTPDEGYVNVSDNMVIFENDYAHYVNKVFPSWVNNYPAKKFTHLVYATTQTSLASAINLSKQRNAGHIYITDDVYNNPWDTLPPYWSSEVAQKCTQ